MSDDGFERWSASTETSWPWRVFKQHNNELVRMFTAFDNAHKFTYENLGDQAESWGDHVEEHFEFETKFEFDRFFDLDDWSDAFNKLKKWINLNALVTISANLETYVATIIPIALRSNIGVLFGCPKMIDGVRVLKEGDNESLDFSDKVEECINGQWMSRMRGYEKIFGEVPEEMEDNLSNLDKIRNIRNNVAHALGRDIQESREKGQVTTLPMETVSRSRFLKFRKSVWEVAIGIDSHLLEEHIGEFEYLRFYHNMYQELNKDVHVHMRAQRFKKALGQHGSQPMSKEYCRGLVKYYEDI